MFGNIVAWLNQPLDTQQSAFRWFLFVGLIVVSLYMWRLVWRDISRVQRAALAAA